MTKCDFCDDVMTEDEEGELQCPNCNSLLVVDFFDWGWTTAHDPENSPEFKALEAAGEIEVKGKCYRWLKRWETNGSN